MEWQAQTISRPTVCGKISNKSGSSRTPRKRDTANAFAVYRVDCQKEIIRILNPARGNPQKYMGACAEENCTNSISSGVKMTQNCRENSKTSPKQRSPLPRNTPMENRRKDRFFSKFSPAIKWLNTGWSPSAIPKNKVKMINIK